MQRTKSIVCSLEEIRLMKRRKHKKFHINSVSNFLIKFSRNGESTYHNVMITFRLRTESNYNPLLTILEPHKTQLISSAYSFGRQFQLRESYNYNLQLHLVPLTRSRDHLKAISNPSQVDSQCHRIRSGFRGIQKQMKQMITIRFVMSIVCH